MWLGGSEFFKESKQDWWWLRKEAALVLEPFVDTGAVSVTQDSTTIVFDATIAASIVGWHFKTNDDADVFKIVSHTAGSATATLDLPYTGDTNTAAAYKRFKIDYTLEADLLKQIEPFRVYKQSGVRNDGRVDGCDISTLEDQWPLWSIDGGTPTKFAPLSPTDVRFSRYVVNRTRADYDYLRRPSDLTDSPTEEAAVPREYRHILSDGATFYLMIDLDDTRAVGIAALTKAGFEAMALENTARWAHIGRPGQIYSRQDQLERLERPLRSESGAIIG